MSDTFDYRHYAAKAALAPSAGREGADPRSLGTRIVYDTLLLPYALLRYRRLLDRCTYLDSHTYTCFMRSPAQLRLLSGPVIDHLAPEGRLEIALLACSNGAEAYTIASWLRRHRPELDFHIHATDLHPQMVDRAAAASYSRDEVLHSVFMTEDFLRRTFVEDDGRFVVRPEIRRHVSFGQADLLDGRALSAQFGSVPLVVAQNVLFHLPPEACEQAFASLVGLMAPRGALMVAGMRGDLRARLTRAFGLAPFLQDVKRIHEEGRVHTPPHWWRVYWGSEPYLPLRRDAARRYATVFRRQAPSVAAPLRPPLDDGGGRH